ncbi:MAG: NDP-sugar synthase [Actinomycetota bacterium]|nr:NDP-sugar synthase [Actinomycetota bacterium]
MQALILAGGEGTRLRPLTSTIAKPVVPLAGRAFTSYMLDWLRGHGVGEVILACGFLADSVRAILGDGAAHGVRLSYLEEPSPLGTGGAVKFAEDLLEERFLVLNGDVLTDIDLSAQLQAHERTGAQLTLALYSVKDSSAYGLVRCGPDGAVVEFVEKPGPEHAGASLINAGAYVVQRTVLETMGPALTNISIERDVFPGLIGHGLYGYESSGYWLDIGTPERYLQATYDILEGNVDTAVGRQMDDSRSIVGTDVKLEGGLMAPALVDDGCEIAQGATVGPRTVLGRGVLIGHGAQVERSVLLDGVTVGPHSTIISSIVGPDVEIGERCQLERAVLGQGAAVGSDTALEPGARIFPGVRLPEGAIQT